MRNVMMGILSHKMDVPTAWLISASYALVNLHNVKCKHIVVTVSSIIMNNVMMVIIFMMMDVSDVWLREGGTAPITNALDYVLMQ
jgi:hypothetical protein